ncbi:MAG: hypothetical protein EOP86_08340, partial [Verrucomicrobiaceae bacterium]
MPGITELFSPAWSKTTVLWILAMGATAYRYLKLESELRLPRAIDHLEKIPGCPPSLKYAPSSA